MGRCNCPQYTIPSADPHDSDGCPVHDPNYHDPQEEIRKLRADIRRAIKAGSRPTDSMRSEKRQLRERGEAMMAILQEALA